MHYWYRDYLVKKKKKKTSKNENNFQKKTLLNVGKRQKIDQIKLCNFTVIKFMLQMVVYIFILLFGCSSSQVYSVNKMIL